MTNLEAKEMIKKVMDSSDYFEIGVRFEDYDRKIGSACDNSKHNPDREDERDFPEYGTEEYDGLEDLDGTSCYSAEYAINHLFNNDSSDASKKFLVSHCYIIGSDRLGSNDDADLGEILLRNPEVIAKIF